MMPVVIEDSLTIAANSVNNNVIVSNASLRGLIQAPWPCRGSLLCVQPTVGLIIDMDIANRNVVVASNPCVAGAMENPIHMVNDQWYANAGDLLSLRVNNPTGGALTFRYRIMLFAMVDEQGNFMELPPDTVVMQQGPIAVANGAVDQQLIDGLRYSRLPVPSIAQLFMTASAAGLTRSVYIEQERVAPPSAVAPTNRMPQDPFDSTIEGIEVDANESQQVQVSNASGGALNVFWKLKNQLLVRN